MNKEQCQDREGQSHFGEFGWYDGYVGSCKNCRVGLDARDRGACESSDECSEECLGSLKETRQNIISQNIDNMRAGENQKKKEEKEDRAIQVAKREEDKKKVEDAKKAAEEKKEELKVVEEKKPEESKEPAKEAAPQPTVVEPVKEAPKEPVKEEPKNV